MKNWKDINYLKLGNEKQREVYRALKKSNIMEILQYYTPILVGTIPIGIDIHGSDLDIVCSVSDYKVFMELLNAEFSKYDSFRMRYNHDNVLVCNFFIGEFEIEIYATNSPSELTNGYRHMVLEDKLLNIYGDSFRRKIIKLKTSGYKTEPAFAKLLGLKGDPYSALLALERYNEKELYSLYKNMNSPVKE